MEGVVATRLNARIEGFEVQGIRVITQQVNPIKVNIQAFAQHGFTKHHVDVRLLVKGIDHASDFGFDVVDAPCTELNVDGTSIHWQTEAPPSCCAVKHIVRLDHQHGLNFQFVCANLNAVESGGQRITRSNKQIEARNAVNRYAGAFAKHATANPNSVHVRFLHDGVEHASVWKGPIKHEDCRSMNVEHHMKHIFDKSVPR